ncbi:CAP domain-containing protein [Dactylosporangium sp. NPDC005555]|uniref:CAP domain-containing protein n=1 Tax=Dactylosporangium sp. NPDC005555 TaxID=3154889 RepID=UPI0033A967BB
MSAFGPYDARNTEPAHHDAGHGDNWYGNAAHDNAAHGDAPYGNAAHGDAPYGDRVHGNAPYGDGAYGNGPYGDGGHGQAPEADEHEPRHRRGTRLAVIVGVGVAALLVVGATAFGGAVLLGNRSDTGDAARTSVAGDATGDPANAGDMSGGDPSGAAPSGGVEGATASPAPTTPASSAAPTKAATTPPAKPKTTAPAAGGNASYEAQVLAIVNTERAKAGCKPLAYNAKLTTAARKHSQDMATNDYFSHDSQDGTGFATRITNAGYKWSGAAENIAKGQRTPADVMNAWMNSSGHRANILNCGLKDLGVGLAYQGKTPIWTQDFGSPR